MQHADPPNGNPVLILATDTLTLALFNLKAHLYYNVYENTVSNFVNKKVKP